MCMMLFDFTTGRRIAVKDLGNDYSTNKYKFSRIFLFNNDLYLVAIDFNNNINICAWVGNNKFVFKCKSEYALVNNPYKIQLFVSCTATNINIFDNNSVWKFSGYPDTTFVSGEIRCLHGLVWNGVSLCKIPVNELMEITDNDLNQAVDNINNVHPNRLLPVKYQTSAITIEDKNRDRWIVINFVHHYYKAYGHIPMSIIKLICNSYRITRIYVIGKIKPVGQTRLFETDVDNLTDIVCSVVHSNQ